MGILLTVGIIASILTAGGTGYLVYKEGKRSLEKVDRIIQEVDNKPEDPKKPEDAIKEILDKVNGDSVDARWILKVEPKDKKEEVKTEEETTEKIIDDIEKSFRDMGLNDEADAYADAAEAIDSIVETVAYELNATKEELVKHGENELEKLKGLSIDEIMQKQEEFEQKAKDYNSMPIPRLYAEFDKIFDNHLPIEQAKSTLFGKALADGLITQETYEKAKEHYGKLWDYVGD